MAGFVISGVETSLSAADILLLYLFKHLFIYIFLHHEFSPFGVSLKATGFRGIDVLQLRRREFEPRCSMAFMSVLYSLESP
jgi:hypothetical protein